MNMSDFTDRIDSKLKEKFLKRIAMCESAGIAPNSIAIWKKRGTLPAVDVALKIAKFLDVDIWWLVLGEESETITLTPDQKNFLPHGKSFPGRTRKK